MSTIGQLLEGVLDGQGKYLLHHLLGVGLAHWIIGVGGQNEVGLLDVVMAPLRAANNK
jgi:hypothetical protein